MSSIAKIAAVGGALLMTVLLLIASLAGTLGTLISSPSTPSQAALADIPADYLSLYIQAAATCPGLDWSVLAAIGKVETDHGRSTLPGVAEGTQNAAGARGPMQILQPTFDEVTARHTIPPGGHHPPSPWNTHDAIFAASFYLCDNLPDPTSRTCTPPQPPPDQAEPSAPVGKAFYLCDHGAPPDIRAALLAYNPSDAYITEVLAQADRYRQTAAIRTDWPPERASVPDPSGTGGTVTPRTAALYRALAEAGALRESATCWDRHPQNPDSDHPLGRACDLFFDPSDPTDVARGWALARWLVVLQATFGVHYLIWQGLIWTAENPKWRIYYSGIYACPNPTNVTGCHYDHIHFSLY